MFIFVFHVHVHVHYVNTWTIFTILDLIPAWFNYKKIVQIFLLSPTPFFMLLPLYLCIGAPTCIQLYFLSPIISCYLSLESALLSPPLSDAISWLVILPANIYNCLHFRLTRDKPILSTLSSQYTVYRPRFSFEKPGKYIIYWHPSNITLV